MVKTLIVARSWYLLKVEGQEHVCFKSVGWTMRSFILAPGEASTYHHVPMSCPPLKSIHSTIFSRSGLLLQTFRSTLCRLRGPSRQSGPLSLRYPSRENLRSDQKSRLSLPPDKRKLPKSRTASQDQWVQMLLARRSVAWPCMDREIVQVLKYKFPQSLD